MASGGGTTSDTSCPFIDLNDPRCASSFTLGRLDRAFDVCLRRPLACQTFYRIAIEQRAQGIASAGIIALTVGGTTPGITAQTTPAAAGASGSIHPGAVTPGSAA